MKSLRVIDIVKSTNAIDYTSIDRFATVTSVEFNSQNCKPGSLFVPLNVGKTDGHLYIQNAIENGAVATLWSNSQESAPDNISCIFVEDTLQALQDLATNYLKNYHTMRVVGVTGSNGKTTTKDMIYSVLSTTYKTYKTQGNYNNHIGVPKTILDAPSDTEVIVVEMGMDNFNQISVLSNIAKPEISVITLIGESHLEFLKSREGIAKAKLEILDGMSADSTLLVPWDEPLLNKSFNYITLQTFGQNDLATLQIGNVTSDKTQTHFVNVTDNIQITLPVIGSYNANNAAAAILVGKYFNINLATIKYALEHFTLTKNRVEWLDGIKNSFILNDAYNASPTSMSAILRDFQNLPANKIAILGSMKELGEKSNELHESVFNAINLSKFKHIFLFGEEMYSTFIKLSKQYHHITYEKNSLDNLYHNVSSFIQEKDYVLIKSSFSTNLLSLVERLKKSEL